MPLEKKPFELKDEIAKLIDAEADKYDKLAEGMEWGTEKACLLGKATALYDIVGKVLNVSGYKD